MSSLRGCLLSLIVFVTCAPPAMPVAAQPAVPPPKGLIDGVLKDLDAQKELKEWKGAGPPITMESIAKSVVTRAVDLDGDGQPDWLVVVAHFFWCGAAGNCDLLIYTKDEGGYRRLFPANMAYSFADPAIGDMQLAQVRVGPHRTAGFFDVAWKSDAGSMIAPGPTDVLLTYDGHAYVVSRTGARR